MGRKVDSNDRTTPTGHAPSGDPPMPPARVRVLMDAEALWSGDADRVEAVAAKDGYAAECAPLVEWLRAGGEMRPWWPYRKLARSYRDHIAAGGLPPLDTAREAVA